MEENAIIPAILSISSPIKQRFIVQLIACNDLFILFTDHQHQLYRKDCLEMDNPKLSMRTRIMASKIIFSKIVCGEDHALLIGKDEVNRTSKLYSFGCGDRGQLGNGSISSWVDELVELTLTEEPIDICAGVKFSAVITAPTGTLHTFGWDRVKFANTIETSYEDNFHVIPIAREELQGVGDLRSDGTVSGVQRCACGPWHVIVLAEGTNDIYGWGWNKFGQLGRRDAEIFSCPIRLDDFDNVSESRIIDIMCGSRFTVVMSSAGEVFVM